MGGKQETLEDEKDESEVVQEKANDGSEDSAMAGNRKMDKETTTARPGVTLQERARKTRTVVKGVPEEQLAEVAEKACKELAEQTSKELKDMLQNWVWDEPECEPSKKWTEGLTKAVVDEITGHTQETAEQHAENVTGKVNFKINSATSIMGVFQDKMNERWDASEKKHGEREGVANHTIRRTKEEVLRELRDLKVVVDQISVRQDERSRKEEETGITSCRMTTCPVCTECQPCPEQPPPPTCVANCPNVAVLTKEEVEEAMAKSLEKKEWRQGLACRLDEEAVGVMNDAKHVGKTMEQMVKEIEKEGYVTKDECVKQGVEALKAVKECDVRKLVTASEKIHFATRLMCRDEKEISQEKTTILVACMTALLIMGSMNVCFCSMACKDQRELRRLRRNQTHDANSGLEMAPMNKRKEEKQKKKKETETNE